jgi:multiple sugar transport system substrate-binding protein
MTAGGSGYPRGRHQVVAGAPDGSPRRWRGQHRPPGAAGRLHRRAAIAAGVGGVLALSACGGGGESGPPVLDYYTIDAAMGVIGERCGEESDAYDIDIQLLPNNAAAQREQLLRRLAAEDASVDVMALDPPFMAEFANAEFLRPFTEEERAEFSEGMLQGPVEQSTYDDTLYAAPFYGNTQLLWYKKSVAEAAGLDLENEPVTWDQLIEAAEATGTTLAVQGRRNESLTVWVNALVESAGGSILDDGHQGQPADQVQAAIDSPAGAEAARIMRRIADSPAAPPALGTAGEEESRAAFQSEDGGFMVNWPYVWAAFDAAIEQGVLPEDFKDDVAWTRYPRVLDDQESATPSGGASLAVGAFTEHEKLAVEAVRCLRSAESQKEYMQATGNPAALEDLYDDPDIKEQFPMSESMKEGLISAGPRPITPFYGDVTGTIQVSYHPPDSLSPESTPAVTANRMEAVLANEQLL